MEENRKYELVEDDFIIYKGKKLYRIRALKNSICYRYGITSKGDLGGYVEGYHNLSQEGKCWIFSDAKVYDNARIEGDAVVAGDDIEVFGNAIIKDSAVVSDSVMIYENAVVRNYAKVSDESEVYGNAKIEDNAVVYGNTCVNGNAVVKGTVIVKGDTKISDNAVVVSEKIKGDFDSALCCRVEGADICDNAEIKGQIRMTFRDKLSNNSIISRDGE